jgi:hypothetical protein
VAKLRHVIVTLHFPKANSGWKAVNEAQIIVKGFYSSRISRTTEPCAQTQICIHQLGADSKGSDDAVEYSE